MAIKETYLNLNTTPSGKESRNIQHLRVMKWRFNWLTYLLVVLVILLTISLQLLWLRQIFLAQRVQVKRDLEQAISNAASKNTYISDISGHEQSQNFRSFFLSPHWIAYQQAWHNIIFENVQTSYRSETNGDSTSIEMRISFLNGTTPPRIRKPRRDDGHETLEQVTLIDKKDYLRMDSLTHLEIARLGPHLKTQSLQNNFNNNNPDRLPRAGTDSTATFKSKEYSYNLRLLNTYQLLIPSIDTLVYYRMRYYLLSSLLMAVLTVAGFIFLLRQLRYQRLYTAARLSFTSNMHHELKTPLATLAVALEEISESGLNNDSALARQYMDISRNELRRLNLMIDKVLNLDIADSGKARFRNELFDIQPCIEQVIASMQVQIESSNAQVTWHPWQAPCFLQGDPEHLTNVCYNLVENALKYGGTGVKLEITSIINNDEIVISFRDNGPGIPPMYQDKIFDRFFRIPGNNINVQPVRGSGLGLNYVKETIERHHGRIRLISQPGAGSNFIIYLPSAI